MVLDLQAMTVFDHFKIEDLEIEDFTLDEESGAIWILSNKSLYKISQS